jgi:tetratricopeptide (TPR) repeat protein
MAENPRIEELRRRVQSDPTSIAFAALAEEFRRVGRFDEAIEVCRTGLQRHPAYLSARVTLGRALTEVGDLDGAKAELETVLRTAPENLAAIRGLAQIHERLGHSTEMDPHLAALAAAPPPPPKPAPKPPPSPAPTPEHVAEVAPVPAPPPPIKVAAPAPIKVAAPAPAIKVAAPAPPIKVAVTEQPREDPEVAATLSRLEQFLSGIQTVRASLDTQHR